MKLLHLMRITNIIDVEELLYTDWEGSWVLGMTSPMEMTGVMMRIQLLIVTQQVKLFGM